MQTSQKNLTRFGILMGLMAALSGPALSAPPAFSVAIDSAVVQNNGQLLRLIGTVTSTDPGKPITNINIELLPTVGAPVRLATNLALDPAANGRFSWNGPLPDNGGVAGAQIRVFANIEAVLPVMPVSSAASVAQIKITNAPPIPAGLKIACQTSPNSALSDTCPVLYTNGLAFWPLAYLDNRNSVALVGFTQSGQAVSTQEIIGTRNVWKVMHNEETQTLSFWGQPAGNISVPWASGPLVLQLSAASAPTPPAGMRALCMTGPNSPAPDGVADKCPVLMSKGVMTWAFAYTDNRNSMGLVAYNSAKQIVNQMELIGTRYAWKITTTPADQSATFWGQATTRATTAWNLQPQIKLVSVGSVPTIPSGMKLYCPTSANSPTAPVSTTCPVLFYKGLAFWPFSYVDNRNSMGLVSYNAANKAVSVREVPGVRYIWSVTSNADKQTVSFNGQGKSTVSIGWAEFK